VLHREGEDGQPTSGGGRVADAWRRGSVTLWRGDEEGNTTRGAGGVARLFGLGRMRATWLLVRFVRLIL
jgi:hypothetical protein